ncbi:MAG: hypothetical protein ACFE0O_04565 [Opitutales bacterium]
MIHSVNMGMTGSNRRAAKGAKGWFAAGMEPQIERATFSVNTATTRLLKRRDTPKASSVPRCFSERKSTAFLTQYLAC